MRVKFTVDTVYETEGRNRGPRFEAGKEYDLENAQRWINRGVAVAVADPPVMPPEELKAVEEKRPELKVDEEPAKEPDVVKPTFDRRS